MDYDEVKEYKEAKELLMAAFVSQDPKIVHKSIGALREKLSELEKRTWK